MCLAQSTALGKCSVSHNIRHSHGVVAGTEIEDWSTGDGKLKKPYKVYIMPIYSVHISNTNRYNYSHLKTRENLSDSVSECVGE